MQLTDHEKYFNYLRISHDTFQKLLGKVGPSLNKLYCIREAISAGERLALTLRFLASGDSMMSISYAYRIDHNTASKIIKETCNVIWTHMYKDILFQPTVEGWLKVEEGFNKKWQLPHCVGAIDGKHVVIQAPPNSGSTFYNDKGTQSIVLMALCDSNYRFTLVDIGSEGRQSDGEIWKNIMANTIGFPPPIPLGDSGDLFNYYIAADEAFSLSANIMRPYPGRYLSQEKRIFNYRLCRGRRIIENVFGIWASRWRIFRKPIIDGLATVGAIMKATVCLHNFIINMEEINTPEKRYLTSFVADREDNIGEVIEGDWRKEDNLNLTPVTRMSSNMYGR